MAIVLEEISAYLDSNKEKRWGEKAWIFDDDGNFVNVFPIVRDKDESWANEKIKKYGLENIGEGRFIDARVREMSPFKDED